ncbi:transglutaminase domain-containing protein [Azotobacter vinelandii]
MLRVRDGGRFGIAPGCPPTVPARRLLHLFRLRLPPWPCPVGRPSASACANRSLDHPSRAAGRALLERSAREAVRCGPKPLWPGRGGIDELPCAGRRGFCEHFSSLLIFVLRAVGIPGRRVRGRSAIICRGSGSMPMPGFECGRPQCGWTSVDSTSQAVSERIGRVWRSTRSGISSGSAAVPGVRFPVRQRRPGRIGIEPRRLGRRSLSALIAFRLFNCRGMGRGSVGPRSWVRYS